MSAGAPRKRVQLFKRRVDPRSEPEAPTVRRCSSCEVLGQPLVKRRSPVHGPLWLCESCEVLADSKGWIE
jgi:hypothetical protein